VIHVWALCEYGILKWFYINILPFLFLFVNYTYIWTDLRSLDCVLSHWAHFTVRRSFLCMYYFVSVCTLHACVLCSIVTWWGGPGGIEAWCLGLLLPLVLWHCWLGHLTRKPVLDMTYNVFSGTLNPTESINQSFSCLVCFVFIV